MTPVQSQPFGQFPLAVPNLSEASDGPTPTPGTAGGATFSQARPSMDGVRMGWCERPPLPNPIVGGPNPYSPGGDPGSPGGTQNPGTNQTSGSTGNSFLDLISQLMSQLDSVISGLGGGTATSGGGGVSTPLPVSSTSPQPDPDSSAQQPDSDGGAMRRLLATGEVS